MVTQANKTSLCVRSIRDGPSCYRSTASNFVQLHLHLESSLILISVTSPIACSTILSCLSIIGPAKFKDQGRPTVARNAGPVSFRDILSDTLAKWLPMLVMIPCILLPFLLTNYATKTFRYI